MYENLKNRILSEYRSLGGCKDIYRELYAAEDSSALMKVYLTHPDWCMELNFPSLDTLRENAAAAAEHNIYVDRKFSGETINSQVAVFHHCSGHINVAMDYENAVIPMLYFCNDCQLHVECKQVNLLPIHVPLYIFGDNLITTNGYKNAVFNRHQK